MNEALNFTRYLANSGWFIPPRQPKVFTVRWHDEDSGWNTLQVIAYTREDAQTVANQVSGGNYSWVYPH